MNASDTTYTLPHHLYLQLHPFVSLISAVELVSFAAKLNLTPPYILIRCTISKRLLFHW